MELAEALDGLIINADSAQVYADLRVVTARPSIEDEKRVPHALYGIIDGAGSCSAADWAKQAAFLAKESGRMPIFVGGTGLYFRAIFEGLAELPPISAPIRRKWREKAKLASEDLHAELGKRDPIMAKRLMPNDTQRIVRALEVIEATGKSLADIQARPAQPLLDPERWLRLFVTVERPILEKRIAQRWSNMLKDGAIDEVAALLSRGLDPMLPVMKAIGVRELASCVQGKTNIEEAGAKTMLATRQYAKRQETWFRNQMRDWRKTGIGEARDLVKDFGGI